MSGRELQRREVPIEDEDGSASWANEINAVKQANRVFQNVWIILFVFNFPFLKTEVSCREAPVTT